MSETELVITAPPEIGSHLAYHTKCRMTLGVLTELVACSRNRVVVSAPFLQHGEGLSKGPLAQAVEHALKRGVRVEVLSTGDALERIGLELERLDGGMNVRLYQATSNYDNRKILGSHAKFCISDCSAAYIGSANLTGPGLSSHLEIGVLVKGKVAAQLAAFWEYSLEVGLFRMFIPRGHGTAPIA